MSDNIKFLRVIMKRSQINSIIRQSIDFFEKHNFILPPFAYFNLKDWRNLKEDASEIFDIPLGWDITDFGKGNFDNIGLILFTLRNGKLGSDKYTKPYTEKIMIQKKDQITPMHFHKSKMEDIINRGGGVLAIQLYMADENGQFSADDLSLSMDGIKKTFKAGEWVYIKPGQSITLTQAVYHTFHAENSDVLVGEVSMVNDDHHDNFFYDEVGRFPEILEDVEPAYLLVNDYSKFLKP